MSETVDKHARRLGYGGLVVALLSLLVALSSHCHNVSEAERRRETNFSVDACMYWDSVYVDSFVHKTAKGIRNFASSKETIYYGFNAYVDVRILNTSEHEISVKQLYCLHSIDNHSTREQESRRCFKSDLSTPIEFPVYVKPNQETRILVRIEWPVVESVARLFTKLANDRHYYFQEITDIYNKYAPEPYNCLGSYQPDCLEHLFTHQFCGTPLQETSPVHFIRPLVILSTDETQFVKVII